MRIITIERVRQQLIRTEVVGKQNGHAPVAQEGLKMRVIDLRATDVPEPAVRVITVTIFEEKRVETETLRQPGEVPAEKDFWNKWPTED